MKSMKSMDDVDIELQRKKINQVKKKIKVMKPVLSLDMIERRAMLEAFLEKDDYGPIMKVVASMWYEAVEKGNINACQHLMDRYFGPVRQNIDISGGLTNTTHQTILIASANELIEKMRPITQPKEIKYTEGKQKEITKDVVKT